MGDEAGFILKSVAFIYTKIYRRLFWPLFEVYTDGSVKQGRGAWAYVVVRRQVVQRENCALVLRPTNNEMEFQAAIEALASLPEKTRVVLYTDSRVLIEAVQKVPQWKSQGWVKSRGQRIPQLSQIQRLDQLLQFKDVQLQWVKAHSGIRHNERCDALCILARSRAT